MEVAAAQIYVRLSSTSDHEHVLRSSGCEDVLSRGSWTLKTFSGLQTSHTLCSSFKLWRCCFHSSQTVKVRSAFLISVFIDLKLWRCSVLSFWRSLFFREVCSPGQPFLDLLIIHLRAATFEPANGCTLRCPQTEVALDKNLKCRTRL